MQTRLVLIRHGQVDAAWQGTIYGAHEVPLSDFGEKQAEQAAQKLQGLELAAVISSPLSRAVYGAKQIRLGRMLEGLQDHDLREIERGAWVGKSVAALNDCPGLNFAQWMQDPSTLRPPEGECLNDLAARVLPCLDRWAAAFAGKTIAIVAHSWVIRVALCEALGVERNRATRIELGTGAIAAVGWRQAPSARGTQREMHLIGVGLQGLPDPTRWFQGSK